MDVAAAGADQMRRNAAVPEPDVQGLISKPDLQALPTTEKGPTFVGPVSGITPSANRPDPDGPGGLGAEESGTERTGPTQYPLVATQRGGRLAEVGQQ